MSTIGGIFRRDDAPLDPERMDRLCQALRLRGPDGGRTSVEGPVAMAHHAFHTAPGPHESLPLRSSRGVRSPIRPLHRPVLFGRGMPERRGLPARGRLRWG